MKQITDPRYVNVVKQFIDFNLNETIFVLSIVNLEALFKHPTIIKMDATFWNDRYSEAEWAYGKEANDFLIQQITKIKETDEDRISSMKVLCIADGEGRNSIYLAKLGFIVAAMDMSEVGMQKLNDWASTEGVNIATTVSDLESYDFGSNQWDIIVSIFAHTPPTIRNRIHRCVFDSLKVGGLFIFEAYHPENIGKGTGGPQSDSLCVRKGDLETELFKMDIIQLYELSRRVDEGKYHTGMASVTQCVARKSFA